MKPGNLTVVVCAACICIITVVLFHRNRIYHTGVRQPALDVQTMGSDPYAGGRITIHYHERHPYYVSHGKRVGGIIGNRINVVFSQAGIPLAWQQTPAKRQLDIIKKNTRREGAVGWFRTPEREVFAKFSRPIYRDRPTIALSRADRELIQSGGTLADTLSNRQLVLLKKDGYSYGTFIDRQIETCKPSTMVTSADNQGMLKMLHTRRVDYFFIAEEEAHGLLSHSGLPASDFKTITFSDMPGGNCRYILFSRRVEASTIDRLDRVIANYGIDEPDNSGSTDR
jgi:polar amino acid transport system substrate-binding protein